MNETDFTKFNDEFMKKINKDLDEIAGYYLQILLNIYFACDKEKSFNVTVDETLSVVVKSLIKAADSVKSDGIEKWKKLYEESGGNIE